MWDSTSSAIIFKGSITFMFYECMQTKQARIVFIFMIIDSHRDFQRRPQSDGFLKELEAESVKLTLFVIKCFSDFRDFNYLSLARCLPAIIGFQTQLRSNLLMRRNTDRNCTFIHILPTEAQTCNPANGLVLSTSNGFVQTT